MSRATYQKRDELIKKAEELGFTVGVSKKTNYSVPFNEYTFSMPCPNHPESEFRKMFRFNEAEVFLVGFSLALEVANSVLKTSVVPLQEETTISTCSDCGGSFVACEFNITGNPCNWGREIEDFIPAHNRTGTTSEF